MKNLLVAFSLVACGVNADELGNILSPNKSLLFDYQLESNEIESDKLSNSWMNPVYLKYSRTYSTQYGDNTIDTGNFSVAIDQPIFRSGGIYYGIKYADAMRNANRAEIKLQKRQMIGNAISILFNLKKTKLEQEKIRYQIKNDTIDIRQKRDSYESGLLDSSFLDQAMLRKSQDETTLLQLELNLRELRQNFVLLSDKNPAHLKLPHLKMMSKNRYKERNLELQRDEYKAEQSTNNVYVTWAKYLPSLSLQGQYIDGDLNPLFRSSTSTLQERYYNYGFSISMPLDINSGKDIELAKLAKLKSAVEVIERKETIEKEYEWIERSLDIYDQRIALSHKDEKVYQSLYRLTQNLVQAGEKTVLDSQTMQNSLKIRKLDQQIYAIEKQIQLLKLYVRMEDAL